MGMPIIAALQQCIHSRYLGLLSIYRFIMSKTFEEAYVAATDIQRQVAIKYIEDIDKRALNEWTRSQLKNYRLHEILSMKDLRLFAQDLGIYNYSRLTRLELISHINQVQNGANRVKSSIITRNGATVITSGNNSK